MSIDKIIRFKEEELEERKRRLSRSELKGRVRDLEETRDFIGSLIPGNDNHRPKIRIIAEIKRASPSKGIIREDIDPVKIANIYESNGATAISIVTERNFFHGELTYIPLVRRITTIPLIRKDFIFDEYQIYEGRVFGADAILLIAVIMGKGELEDLIGLSNEIGMATLVEIHTERDLEKVLSLSCKAELIGINNRDLDTFEVDIDTTFRLIKDIPHERIVVSESGIDTRDVIERLKGEGVDAFLIGEALMKEADIGKKLRELLGEE
ncbi:MAG: indole-3-glycerol phosphate synthase TrpC [Nitrospinae bacterium]|nr:indole-3-glycerol phosphate synthase TrpC [Nitrospinota bacterium]